MSSMPSPGRLLGLLVFLLPASMMMIGCGSKTGTVAGKVTYQGKALSGGFVNFLSEGPNSITKSSGIQKDGSYSVSGLPVGPAKITVQGVKARKLLVPKSMQNSPGVAEAKSDQPEVYVPPEYRSADKSDLKYEVKPGSQQHNIELQ